MKGKDSSFLKKRNKKLLFVGAAPSDRRPARHQSSKVFLLLFLQKKKILSTCLLAASFSAHAQTCTLALSAQVPLRPDGLVEARINHLPALFELDTGAVTTTLTPQAVQRLHLAEDVLSEEQHGSLDGPLLLIGVGGTRAGKIVVTDSFELGAMHGRMHFMTTELGVSGSDGLLSTDLLQKYDIDLDFAGQQIRIFKTSGSCDRPKVFLQPPLYTVPLLNSEVNPSPLLHIVIDGRRFLAMVDTGAQHTAIFHSAARKLGLSQHDLAHDPHHSMRGIGPTLVDSVQHVFSAVSVGDLTIRNMPVEIVNQNQFDQIDVLLGADFQRKIHLWISNATHTLVLQYPPQASPPLK